MKLVTGNQPSPPIDRAGLLDDAITAPPMEVGGVSLRKPSIGTVQLLKRTGNALFSPEGVNATPENAEEFLDDLIAFVYIHAAPIEEVVKACHGPRADFELKVAEFALTLDMDKLPELVEAVQLESNMAGAAQVSPEPEEGGDDDPNGSGQSGMQA